MIVFQGATFCIGPLCFELGRFGSGFDQTDFSLIIAKAIAVYFSSCYCYKIPYNSELWFAYCNFGTVAISSCNFQVCSL